MTCVLAGVFSSSCAASEPSPCAPAPAPALPSPSPEQTARRYIEEVWNQGKYDGAPLFAPQMTGHFRGQTFKVTPAESYKMTKDWREAFPDFRFRIEDVFVRGDTVVMRIPFSGTHRGKFWGIEPTGKRIDVTETLTIRFEGGLVAEAWEDYDEYGMRVQLGQIKPSE